jgi:hypothetical protein
MGTDIAKVSTESIFHQPDSAETILSLTRSGTCLISLYSGICDQWIS